VLRKNSIYLPFAALALIGTALTGCSGRDTDLSEKVAAADAAARRAEAAAVRAENAAKAAEKPQVAQAEVDPESDGTEDDGANQDPNSAAFQNGG
jgi:hypothetical protein